jgi:catecholate siderophore receptor
MGGNLSLTSAVFRIEKTNARSQIAPGEFQLTGDVRVNGFELGAAGRITSRWQVLAGYTYLDAKIVAASPLDGTLGKVPLNTPRNSATLWTTYNVSREWEAGGGLTYMSDRFVNNTNVVSVGSYVRFDATVAYHQPKYDVRLNLLNLANRLNYDALIQSDGGRSVPGIDRTLLATFTYKF